MSRPLIIDLADHDAGGHWLKKPPKSPKGKKEWAAQVVKEWDESQHPRAPAGSAAGGEFTEGGGGGAAVLIDRWVNAYEKSQDLRNPKTPEGKVFTSMLDALPTYAGVVWRGSVASEQEIEALTEGSVQRMALHSSASKNRETAERFITAGDYYQTATGGTLIPILFQVKTTTGAEIAPQTALAATTHGHTVAAEQEVILKAGAKYRVESAIWSRLPGGGGKQRIVTFQEV